MVVADDWATYQHDNAHTGRSSADFNPTLLQKAWGSTEFFSPIVVGNSVFAFNSSQGRIGLASFNLLNGQQLWRKGLEGQFASSLTYAEGLLIFASYAPDGSNPQLLVYDASTGTQKYTVALPANDVPAAVSVARNSNHQLVAYESNGYGIAAVNLGATSGSVLWSRSNNALDGFSIPTLVGDSVIVAASNHYYAYDQLDGALNEFYNGSGGTGGASTVAFDSARSQFYVRVAGLLTAFSYNSNSEIIQRWQTAAPGNDSLAIGADGDIYVSNSISIAKRDPIDGHLIQSVDGLQLSSAYTPAISANALFIYGSNSPISAWTNVYDLNTLALIETLPFGRSSSNTPAKSPGAIFDNGYVVYHKHGFDVYWAVPEPSTLALALSTFATLAAYRRRRGSE
jgi:hypothetical protein